MDGQRNDLHLRASPAHLTRKLHAADIGQGKIDHRDIRGAFANGLQARCPGIRLPDQFDLGHALQQRPNAGEHDGMIIDESDANGRHLTVSSCFQRYLDKNRASLSWSGFDGNRAVEKGNPLLHAGQTQSGRLTAA